MASRCKTHVTKHFLPGRGYFAWCEDHGRLLLKSGKAARTDGGVFTNIKAIAHTAAKLHKTP